MTILDDLIQNAGSGFQKSFADEPLLERLRLIVTDPTIDAEVKAKCNALYRQWAFSYKNTPGMHNIANLYRQLPQRKRVVNKENSKVLRETERQEEDDEDDHAERKAAEKTAERERRRSSTAAYHATASQLTFAPASYTPQRGGSSFSSPISTTPAPSKKDKKSKKSKQKPFNFEKEKGQINSVISLANIESTGLNNALKLINRETERVSDNANAKRRFETCKTLRRQTFRYCNLVMDENYLATLLNANDQLSDALILYEQLDKSFDYDSDSEDYEDPDAKGKSPASPPMQQQFAGLNINSASPPKQPARPTFHVTMPPNEVKGKAPQVDEDEPDDEDDENDPFADRNEVSTPGIEKSQMTW